MSDATCDACGRRYQVEGHAENCGEHLNDRNSPLREDGSWDAIWHQALALLRAGAVEDVSRVPDDTGTERLVRIDFLDSDDYMIAGEEDFDGEPAGYTYTLYDSNCQYLSTDGGPDVAAFSDEVRRLIGVQSAKPPKE